MSDQSQRTWEDALESLRRAANELQSAVTGLVASSGGESEEASRLKADVSRLERAAGELRAKMASETERQRSEVESSFDRQRAEERVSQMRTSLEELAAMATSLAAQMAAAAGSGLKQAEPELKAAVRSIEDVAGSTAAWMRATLDATLEQRSGRPEAERPTLDDL